MITHRSRPLLYLFHTATFFHFCIVSHLHLLRGFSCVFLLLSNTQAFSLVSAFRSALSTSQREGKNVHGCILCQRVMVGERTMRSCIRRNKRMSERTNERINDEPHNYTCNNTYFFRQVSAVHEHLSYL